MKLSKKIAVAASVGALGLAAAVPAMALENEFSGIYNLGFFVSNVENGGTGAIDPKAMYNANKTHNYFDQRARLKYSAKANDDLKLVTHFELDSRFGGNGVSGGAATKNTSDSGQLDADSIMIETKNVYLDFNLGKNVNVKTGIQTVSDKLKGTLYSVADMAGINTTTKLGALDLNAAYFRVGAPLAAASTGNNGTMGYNNFDIAVLDAQYNISKNANVGAVYYMISDNTSTTTTASNQVSINTLGVYGSTKLGAATLSGFAAMQQGYVNSASATLAKQMKSGYAASADLKVPVGPGTFKVAALYTSGDDGRDRRDTSWYSLQHSNLGNTGTSAGSLSAYNSANMMLLNRNLVYTGLTSTQAIVTNVGGVNSTGVEIVSIGYDATITPKTFANVNAGVMFATKNQSTTRAGSFATNQGNGSNLMGTEVNVEAGYKVFSNLTASVQAAYVFLGGYYNGCGSATAVAASTPGKNAENPYTTRIMLKYAF